MATPGPTDVLGPAGLAGRGEHPGRAARGDRPQAQLGRRARRAEGRDEAGDQRHGRVGEGLVAREGPVCGEGQRGARPGASRPAQHARGRRAASAPPPSAKPKRDECGGHPQPVGAQQQVAHVGVDGVLQATVGQLEAGAAPGVHAPARGDLGGGRERVHVERAAVEREHDAEGGGVGQREDDRGLGPPVLGTAPPTAASGWAPAAEHHLGHVAVGLRPRHPAAGRSGRQQHEAPVDPHLGALGRHLLDGTATVRVGGPHGQGDREGDLAVVLDLDHDDRRAGGVTGRRRPAAPRRRRAPAPSSPRRGSVPMSRWRDGGLVGRHVPAVLGADPPVEHPRLRRRGGRVRPGPRWPAGRHRGCRTTVRGARTAGEARGPGHARHQIRAGHAVHLGRGCSAPAGPGRPPPPGDPRARRRSTDAAIGRSTPCSRASSMTTFEDFTPSATMFISAMISSILRPLPSCSPT